MTRFRGLAVLIALVSLVALASAGSWTRTAAVPQSQPNAISAPAPAPESQQPDQAACSDPFGNGTEVKGCHDCPTSLLPGCTRLSCDPCCFHCPGEPFNRCL
jgi:hypothetical protein